MITAITVLGGALVLCVLGLVFWAVASSWGATSMWPDLDDGLTITEAMHAELLARSDALERQRIRARARVVSLG